MSLRVSVVIPTYRRPELLRRCLTALSEQDLDAGSYEVIVADDEGSQVTRHVIETWSTGHPVPPVTYIPVTETRGPAAARNAGWRSARAPIVAFTDDDCVPAPGWLSGGLSAFVDGVVGACGRINVPVGPNPTDYEWNATGLARSEFTTANCFYRREVLERVGGFDERYACAWREDSDLYFTVMTCRGEDGDPLRLVQARDAVVTHPIRPAPWGVSLRQQRKSMFNALLYKKHPQLYRERLSPVRPYRYYAILTALVLAAVGVVGRRRWLAVTGGVAWAWLTGRFCAERLRETSHAPRHVLEMLVTSALIPPLSVFWRLVGALRFRVFFY